MSRNKAKKTTSKNRENGKTIFFLHLHTDVSVLKY